MCGRLEFANSTCFACVVFGEQQTKQICFKYGLLITFLRLLFLFFRSRMSVLVYRRLNSVSSASSGVGRLLYPPLTICLNYSIQTVYNFLIFSSFLYQACVPYKRRDRIHAPISLVPLVMFTFWSVR